MICNIFTLLALPAVVICAPHFHHRHLHSAQSASDVPAKVLSTRSTLTATSGQVYLKNSCDYAVSVEPYPASGCSCGDGGEIAAGSSWNDTLTACSGGNTSLKVYRVGESSPMQFEYGLADSKVWYDMSFIDCVASGHDFSACAGSGWAMASMSECTSFSCTGGSECCQQGYCDPDATGVNPAPNAGCGPDQGYTDSNELGIVIELCASS